MTQLEFKAFVYKFDPRLPVVPSTTWEVLLDMATSNVRDELKAFQPSIFIETLSSVALGSSAGYSMPSGWVEDEGITVTLENRPRHIISNDEWWTHDGQIYGNGTYDIIYKKDLDDTSLETNPTEQDFPFTNKKCKHLLARECQALVYAWNEENEANNGYRNSIEQANRIS